MVNSQIVETENCGKGGDLTPSSADFRIGHRENFAGDAGHSHFQGDLDETMVFNVALSERDLSSLFRGQYRTGHKQATGYLGVHHSHQLDSNLGSKNSAVKHTVQGTSSGIYRRSDTKQIRALAKTHKLIGFWGLDGDTKDYTGNGLDGIAQNAEWTSGVYGHALHFDGNDGLQVPAAKMAKIAVDSITMAAWIRAESNNPNGKISTTGKGSHGIIFNKEVAYEVGITSGVGKLQAAFASAANDGEKKNQVGCWRWWGNIVIPAHDWVHVAVAYDGKNEYHYVGGSKVEQMKCGNGGKLVKNNNALRIGARMHNRKTIEEGGHGHAEWIGDIDEAMIFSKAITQAELDYVYNIDYAPTGCVYN